MSDSKAGTISWMDLTVPNADEVRDFYQAVAGWKAEGCDMGDYQDYSMMRGDGQCVAGICHARGPNAGLPAQWLLYITVDDLDAAMKTCRENGGEILREPPEDAEGARFCVIKDPAGAVAALYQEG
ncbi:MAG: VOC family protein [Acidobacteriota bacterium]|nr:VOC family protein [Acidobacteriota bacterium]